MKGLRNCCRLAATVGVFCALFGLFQVQKVEAQTTNKWRQAGGGKWETASNWTAGTPSLADAVDIINTGLVNTITVDGTTVLSNGVNSCMTVSNLVVAVLPFATNTLLLSNSGTNVPLHLLSSLTLTNGGALTVTNAALQVDGLSGGSFLVEGPVTNLAGGLIVTTNTTTTIGNTARGALTMIGGMFLASNVTLAADSGSQGTLAIMGSTCSLSGNLQVGLNANATGTVWVTGGLLVVTNGVGLDNSIIGNNGSGQLTISNGTVVGNYLTVGLGNRGTLTLAGGTNAASADTILGNSANSTGTVWVTGALFQCGGTIMVGRFGTGQMTISNGVFLANVMRLGTNATGRGTLTVAGGTNALTGPLSIGGLGTGTVWVTGGQLVVTNTPAAVGAGSGFVVDGSVTINSGSAINVSNVNNVTVGNRGSGSLTMNGGSLTTSFGNLAIGASPNAAGEVWVNGNSSIIMTNPGSTIFVGGQGTGRMALSNGTVSVSAIVVGNVAPVSGTLTVAGGTMAVGSDFDVGENAGSTGAVWMTGGTLTATNSNQIVGLSGVGQMTLSNGVTRFRRVLIGSSNIGTFTIAGGTNLTSTELQVGATTTGTLWLTGGQLVTTNTTQANVGRFGVGRMIVSNGIWSANVAAIAPNAGSQGTLTVAGGSSSVYSNLTVGRYACDSTAIVNVNAGTLAITNAAVNAVLDVRGGTLTQSGGTLWFDFLYVTNACARFIRTGGSLNINGLIYLTPGFDADGDGIPNASDIDAFNPADANEDPDGDGFTNLQEFQAGTNPFDNTSFFAITSITQVAGTNILITWQTGIGKTNALERSPGAGGSYSNNFAAIFTVTNTVGTTTNYLDFGAATNVPALFYRVRLVP